MLQIDREFADQIPPLTEEEFRQLEENILRDGTVLMPLITWNGVIVDGHNRYKIIQDHPELEYNTYEIQFADRNAAFAWICKNQLGRRNLTPEQKKYLIGEQYRVEKASRGGSTSFRGNQYVGSNDLQREAQMRSKPKIEELTTRESTSERIARENHVSHAYVERAGQYAKGVNAAEMAFPGIKRQILFGEICPTEAAVKAVADAPQEERENLAKHLQDESVQRRGKRRRKKEEIDPIILQVVEEMHSGIPQHKIDEYSMLGTLRGIADTMISNCNSCFRQFPTLLTEQIYREQVLDILKEPKDFILSLEQGGQNPSNAAPSDTAVMPEELCATNATITNEGVYL